MAMQMAGVGGDGDADDTDNEWTDNEWTDNDEKVRRVQQNVAGAWQMCR